MFPCVFSRLRTNSFATENNYEESQDVGFWMREEGMEGQALAGWGKVG